MQVETNSLTRWGPFGTPRAASFTHFRPPPKLHAVAPGGPPEGHHGRRMDDEEKRRSSTQWLPEGTRRVSAKQEVRLRGDCTTTIVDLFCTRVQHESSRNPVSACASADASHHVQPTSTWNIAPSITSHSIDGTSAVVHTYCDATISTCPDRLPASHCLAKGRVKINAWVFGFLTCRPRIH